MTGTKKKTQKAKRINLKSVEIETKIFVDEATGHLKTGIYDKALELYSKYVDRNPYIEPAHHHSTTEDFAIVYFDLETGGRRYSDDILQISMKCGNLVFNRFLTPTRAVASDASRVNGLTEQRGRLYKRGHEVQTYPSFQVLREVLDFLRTLGKRCVLVAHNCVFDATRLTNAMHKHGYDEEFEQYVEGFTDTLEIFRKIFPKRPTGHSLTTLASELLHLPCGGAHDASFDVDLLEKLTQKYISREDLIANKKAVVDIKLILDNHNKCQRGLAAYAPMSAVISQNLMRSLLVNDVTYELLVRTFHREGPERTKSLLTGKVKSQRTVNAILDYLSNLT